MSTIYIITDFGKLNKKGETLQLCHSDGTISIIFPYKTEQLVVIGNIEITGRAFKLLMHYKIETIFLNKNGRFNGKLVFQEGKNVFLRQKQYKLLEDEDFKLRFTRSVIKAKLKNQLTFMQRIKRERRINIKLDSTINKMKDNVESAIESEGLDCYVGYLHSIDYGRKSLTFDLMEEYRTPIADTLTAACFNLGILDMDDFNEVVFGKNNDDLPLELIQDENKESILVEEKKGVLLTKEGLKKVIAQFEKKLDTGYYYPVLEKSITYKAIIREQVKHFKRMIMGEEQSYKPLIIK